MAAKKKTSNNSGPLRGMTASGKEIKWNEPTKYKATEAITAKGQKAKGLVPSNQKNRFSSTAKTPVSDVKKGTWSLRGTGTPLGTSLAIQPINKQRIASTLLVAAGGVTSKGSGVVTKAVTKKLVGRYGGAAAEGAAEGAFVSAAKGIKGMSGGGKIKTANTPFGMTLRSTKIMNPAQKSAAQTGLLTRAGNIAGDAATGGKLGLASQVVQDVNKVTSVGKKVVRNSAIATAAAPTVKNKLKKKK